MDHLHLPPQPLAVLALRMLPILSAYMEGYGVHATLIDQLRIVSPSSLRLVIGPAASVMEEL